MAIPSQGCFGVDYCFSAAGNDETGDGSIANPWRIIAGGITYTGVTAWLNAVTSQERLDSNDDDVINNLDARIALAINPGFLDRPGCACGYYNLVIYL